MSDRLDEFKQWRPNIVSDDHEFLDGLDWMISEVERLREENAWLRVVLTRAGIPVTEGQR